MPRMLTIKNAANGKLMFLNMSILISSMVHPCGCAFSVTTPSVFIIMAIRVIPLYFNVTHIGL